MSLIKDGDEVVLYSEYQRVTRRLLVVNELLIRAVSGAELDLQFNRPVEAHSKLSAAWKEWLGLTEVNPEVFIANKARPAAERTGPAKAEGAGSE